MKIGEMKNAKLGLTLTQCGHSGSTQRVVLSFPGRVDKTRSTQGKHAEGGLRGSAHGQIVA
jgi:hypothetical protein